MRMRLLTLPALLLLTLSAAASADETTGHYYIHAISETRSTLPDGNTAVLQHFYILGTSDNADAPMNNTAGNCTGNSIVSSEGKTLAASGICFRQDDQGNSFSYWWKRDESDSAKCPHGCGSYRIIDGTGKFKGLTGSGTYVVEHEFADGSSGSSKGSYQMP